MKSLPSWCFELKNAIIEGFNKAMQKADQTKQKPPPGAASDFVLNLICKHVPATAFEISEPPAPKLEELNSKNIYQQTESAAPVQSNELTLEQRAFAYVKSNKPIRLADLAKELGVEAPVLLETVEKSSSLKKAKAGWISAA